MRVYYSILIFLIIIISLLNSDKINTNENEIDFYEFSSKGYINTSKSIIMYESIEKYSEEYKIPRHIAYNIAYKETKYKGPFNWSYNPNRTSIGGAEGAMQIMPSTAKSINKYYISPEELRNDIDINILTSMRLLNKLYSKYGNWTIVCGCYNTGRPIINEYAIFCSTNRKYTSNWVTPSSNIPL